MYSGYQNYASYICGIICLFASILSWSSQTFLFLSFSLPLSLSLSLSVCVCVCVCVWEREREREREREVNRLILILPPKAI